MCKQVEQPRRPHVPITFFALCALLLAERMVLREGAGWLYGTWSRMLMGTACVFALVYGACAFRMRGDAESLGSVLVVALSLIVGVVLSSVAIDEGNAFIDDAEDSVVSSWTLQAMSESVDRKGVFRFRAVMRKPGAHAGAVWMQSSERVPLGATVQVVGRFQRLTDDDWGMSSRMQGLWGTVSVIRITRMQEEEGPIGWIRDVRSAFLDVVEPETMSARALLAGCVCGWRDGLVALGLDAAFSRCGLSHLIAVSGSHMGVLSALVAGFLTRANVRPKARGAVLASICLAYVVFCGAPLSAVRSYVMSCSAMLGMLLGRRAHALSGVCMAGLCMALLDPTVSGQMGFMLSVSSVCGLCMFSAYATYAVEVLFQRRRPWRLVPYAMRLHLLRWEHILRESVAASMVAQVATLPLVVETFDEVSLVGPVVGAIVLPPFTLLVGMGMLAFALGWVPWLQAGALNVCDALAWLILAVVDAFSRLSFACIPVEISSGQAMAGLWVPMAVLLVTWPAVHRHVIVRCSAVFVSVAMVLVTRWRFFCEPRICVLDVGQGDAILVQDGASTILVDTGPDESIVRALARNHVLHLDAVVLTHAHDDHYGGLLQLVGRVPCDVVLVASGVADSLPSEVTDACMALTGKRTQEISFGDALHAAGFDLLMVWPMEPVEGNQNSESIEMVVTYDEDGRELTALLTGDAERDELRELLDYGLVGDVDLLKVGHHGSEVSILDEQARALDPEVAVASAGAGNRYGHPSPECVEVLERSGSTFLCTKDVGDVEVFPGADGPGVRY